ncbi:N-acetylglucosamine-1-phosphotransferase subunits alpha/beta-like [Ornithodoros turicata]|uniref:N-acetylglucosamine-1-phosphotransferase subunits alpha/beta-like n=1 Tax=Ornithodoros turicata TaxID=34597 RepID=UPI003138A89C
MKTSLFCKLVQRQTYNILSQRHLFVIVLIGLLMMGVSVYRISEIALRHVSSVFTDNIASEDLQDTLCQNVPIDAVYTWVNGSDPGVVRNLTLIKSLLENNKTRIPIVVLHTDDRIGHDSFPVKYRIGKEEHKATALVLDSHYAENVASQGYVRIRGKNVTATRAYITESSEIAEMLLLVGATVSPDKNIFLNHLVSRVIPCKKENVALVLTSGIAASELLLASNLTALGKRASLLTAALIVHFENEDVDRSRFADNDELKYSLRSLEKNAAWIRRVFLVTNGQIPSWLNLNSGKISVVTHQEIFVNESHLPTFSSPAIECHLHRIPGLSKRFIYLNDDVMFGKRVWPDDFYSHSNGYKVRLAWSVPDCALGCPTSWIRDGYCDRPCNNSHCQWDGGDCNQITTLPSAKVDVHKMYCSSSCANSWLADRYCDQACNVLECAFDAGDCGVSSYHLLYGIFLDTRVQHYYIPAGETHVYLNLTELFQNDSKVTDGHYEYTEHVRTVAVSLQHKILTLVLGPRKKSTQVHIVLKGIKKGLSFEFPFVVHLNVSQVPTQQHTPSTTTIQEPLVFPKFPEHERYPAVHGGRRSRRLLDTFGDSLRHVNQLYNHAFGFEARKVPSHMAHIIDKDVVERLQARFPEEFDKTSSHRIRSSDDMQFAFSYFYFLMSEKVQVSVQEIFDTFDVDMSGTWSDNEIHTVVANLNDLPLEYESTVGQLQEMLISCKKNGTAEPSKQFVINCDPLVQLLKKTLETKHVNHFTTIKEDDYAFVMIKNNVSLIVAQMDQLRKRPKKFICLNDNIDHSRKDAQMVKAVVRDLYDSLFPTRSSFELTPEYRNRFSYMKDLHDWRKHKNILATFLTICFLFFFAFTLFNLYQALVSRESCLFN